MVSPVLSASDDDDDGGDGDDEKKIMKKCTVHAAFIAEKTQLSSLCPNFH